MDGRVLQKRYFEARPADGRNAERIGVDGEAQESAAHAALALVALHHRFQHVISLDDEARMPFPSGDRFVIEFKRPEPLVQLRFDTEIAKDRG